MRYPLILSVTLFLAGCGSPPGEAVRTEYENGQIASERWFDEGNYVGTHADYESNGDVLWSVEYVSPNAPDWENSSVRAFVNQAANAMGKSTWRYAHLIKSQVNSDRMRDPITAAPWGIDEHTLFKISGRVNGRKLINALGPPHEINHDPSDKVKKQWIYHCGDGTAWLAVVTRQDIPYIISAPGIGVTGKRRF